MGAVTVTGGAGSGAGGVGATGAGGVAGAGLVGAGATGAAEAAGPAAPVMPAEARAGRRPPLPAGAGAPDVTGAFPPAGFFGLGPPGGRLEMLAAARLTSGPSTATSPAVGTASGPSP